MLRSALARRRSNVEDAFTLIELMVIGLVIAILTAIAVPIFMNQQAESVRAGLRSDVRNTVTNVATFQAQNPTSRITSESQTGRNSPAGSPIEIVVSHTASTVQVLAGDGRGEYEVIGSNRAVNFSFSFDSRTGEFTTAGAIAGIGGPGFGSATPGGGAGSGSGTGPVAGSWSENLRNRVPNPMTIQSSGSTRYSTSQVTAVNTGGRLQITATGSTSSAYTYPQPQAGDVQAGRFAVTPGERASFRVRVWNPSATETIYVRLNFGWYNATGGSAPTPTTTISPLFSVAPGFSRVVEHSVIVPPGTNNNVAGMLPILFMARATGTTSGIPAGTTLQHSEWAMYSGPDGSVPVSGVPYFSGNSASGTTMRYRWTGTPHLSASVRETLS